MHCCMSHEFFFELQIYKKICPKLCLVKLFISLPKRFAETGELLPSKAGLCLNKHDRILDIYDYVLAFMYLHVGD